MENITLFYLADHEPSTKTKKELEFWFAHHKYVSLSFNRVHNSLELREAIKKHKVHDLPCLVVQDGKKNRKYYGEGIKSEADRIREEYRGRK